MGLWHALKIRERERLYCSNIILLLPGGAGSETRANFRRRRKVKTFYGREARLSKNKETEGNTSRACNWGGP